MKILEQRLRKIIQEEISALSEAEQANIQGTLDVKQIASTLDVDAGQLSQAVRAPERSAIHNAVLADVFVKLMEAGPESTAKVMNVLKKVKSKE